MNAPVDEPDLDRLRSQLAALLLADGDEAGLRRREDALVVIAREALNRRLQLPTLRPPTDFPNPRDFLRLHLAYDFEREVSGAILFDTESSLLGVHTLAQGSAENVMISAREVFRKALSENATALVTFHSHPSSSAVPSRADLECLRVLLLISKTLEIRLLDDVIQARGGEYYSAKDCGLLDLDAVNLAIAWHGAREAVRNARSWRSRWRQFMSLWRLFRQTALS